MNPNHSHIDPAWLAKYQAEGWSLLATTLPPFATPVLAARVVQTYGFGGVRLSTRRIGVRLARLTSGDFYDMTNDEKVPSSEIEAWKPLNSADPT